MPKPKFPYVMGQWRVICDRCGQNYHNVHLRLEWTGLRTCYGPGTNDCWELRNAQDFVRGVRDKQSPPWSRPRPDSIFTANRILWTSVDPTVGPFDVARWDKVNFISWDGSGEVSGADL